MSVDYEILSKDYDLTRGINIDTVKRIVTKAKLNENSYVLDFGCGTGNYTCAVKRVTGARVYGVEPSDGMREKAVVKDSTIEFKKGDHTCVPFADSFFDLIYMTDVIHHIPDINAMFKEFNRVLKSGGLVCVLTESHEQIETRFWSPYFPGTVTAEKNRYPSIREIIKAASLYGFGLNEEEITDKPQKIKIPADFVRLTENKGYSMFRLISETEFNEGLARLKQDSENETEIETTHGETLLWFTVKKTS